MSFRGQWVRRTLSVLLATFVLLVAPQVAQAAFSSSPSAQMSVGTATMAAPTAVGFTPQCRYSFFGLVRAGVNVNVNDFTDTGPAGSTYTYVLTRVSDGRQLDVETSTNRSMTLSTTTGAPSYRMTIQATLGNWTGPVFSTTIGC